MFEEYEALLNVSDVQGILMTGRNAIYDLIKNNKLRYMRIGRVYKIPKEALIDYINKECELK